MKQIEKIAAAKNFSAVNVGKLDELGDYLLELGPDVKIPGKVFGGEPWGQQEVNFHFRYSVREQKPDFCTHIKNMKNFISFSKEKENFK